LLGRRPPDAQCCSNAVLPGVCPTNLKADVLALAVAIQPQHQPLRLARQLLQVLLQRGLALCRRGANAVRMRCRLSGLGNADSAGAGNVPGRVPQHRHARTGGTNLITGAVYRSPGPQLRAGWVARHQLAIGSVGDARGVRTRTRTRGRVRRPSRKENTPAPAPAPLLVGLGELQLHQMPRHAGEHHVRGLAVDGVGELPDHVALGAACGERSTPGAREACVGSRERGAGPAAAGPPLASCMCGPGACDWHQEPAGHGSGKAAAPCGPCMCSGSVRGTRLGAPAAPGSRRPIAEDAGHLLGHARLLRHVEHPDGHGVAPLGVPRVREITSVRRAVQTFPAFIYRISCTSRIPKLDCPKDVPNGQRSFSQPQTAAPPPHFRSLTLGPVQRLQACPKPHHAAAAGHDRAQRLAHGRVRGRRGCPGGAAAAPPAAPGDLEHRARLRAAARDRGPQKDRRW
jgi:hypothetical protein